MEMQTTRRAVQRVLLTTLVLNLAVAFSKIIIGTLSGALAITADGFHSIIDGAGNVVGLVASRVAAQPPDADHPYGHRRFETLAALMIGAFLLVTAWEIASSALERLQGGEAPQVTLLTFAVLIATLAVNVDVNRYQVSQGKRLKSEILLADAANTGSDIFVTLSVLVSTAIVALTGLGWVDVVAALVVVVLILRAAVNVLRQTGGILVDTAPYSPEALTAMVADVPQVEKVVRARSRGSSDAAHIDLDVQVAPSTTANNSAIIAADIRQRLEQQLGGVQEVEVHFVPASDADSTTTEIARTCADALGLPAHEIHLNGTDSLELHVEVPAGQTLATAHEQASRLERAILERLPQLREVVTHIEPAPPPQIENSDRQQQLEAEALTVLKATYPAIDWHHFRAYQQNAGLTLTLHARMAATDTIETAHDRAEQAEALLRLRFPTLRRVTIHTEPYRG
ncbi:MAG: cation diffusion facilitator family transporter [bacterium]|nr:cation diffusion facilitator family transporter [bacterium]